MTGWQEGCVDGWEAARKGVPLDQVDLSGKSEDYIDGFKFGWEEEAERGNKFVKTYPDIRSDHFFWAAV